MLLVIVPRELLSPSQHRHIVRDTGNFIGAKQMMAASVGKCHAVATGRHISILAAFTMQVQRVNRTDSDGQVLLRLGAPVYKAAALATEAALVGRGGGIMAECRRGRCPAEGRGRLDVLCYKKEAACLLAALAALTGPRLVVASAHLYRSFVRDTYCFLKVVVFGKVDAISQRAADAAAFHELGDGKRLITGRRHCVRIRPESGSCCSNVLLERAMSYMHRSRGLMSVEVYLEICRSTGAPFERQSGYSGGKPLGRS